MSARGEQFTAVMREREARNQRQRSATLSRKEAEALAVERERERIAGQQAQLRAEFRERQARRG